MLSLRRFLIVRQAFFVRGVFFRKRFFTLVELLTVVAVIMILVSLLLPALNKARGMANSALCISNLRQLGAAVLSYGMDNQESLVPPINRIQKDLSWDDLLGVGGYDGRNLSLDVANSSYVLSQYRGGDVYHCPLLPVPKINPSNQRWTRSYAMNNYLGYDSTSSAASGFNGGTGATLKYETIRFSWLKSPSRLMIISDRLVSNSTQMGADSGAYINGVKALAIDEPFNGYGPFAHHQRTYVNVLFAAGNVRSVYYRNLDDTMPLGKTGNPGVPAR